MSRNPFTEEDIILANQAIRSVIENKDNLPIKASKKVPPTVESLSTLLSTFFVPIFHREGADQVKLYKHPNSVEVTVTKDNKDIVIGDFELPNWDKRRADFIVHSLLLINLGIQNDLKPKVKPPKK